jgi:phage tail sheath protein FI
VELVAASLGGWGNGLRARVDYNTAAGPPAHGAAATSYNLSILDTSTRALEQYPNVDTDPTKPRSLDKLVAASSLVTLPANPVLNVAPPQNAAIDPAAPDQDSFSNAYADRYTKAKGGSLGGALTLDDYLGGAAGQADKQGIYQLYKTGIFNLLCLPGGPAQALPAGLLPAALALCVDRRAILLVDSPGAWKTVAAAVAGAQSPPVSGDSAKNAAVYFPNVVIADPADNGNPVPIPPCGTVAGVAARTDVQSGVWKAPAGTQASLNGVIGLADTTDPATWKPLTLTDGDSGQLNPLGVNVLRSFPVIGPVCWGARTLRGADTLADQWKYLPVRRLALFIEESLYRGTQWVVFEPNAEPLWSAIRLNVGAFMNNLFRQGAFAGVTASAAYLVKCDAENNPQNTIDLGIVNILVGFAPLKPAEFVIIHIEQLAGQLQA